MCFGAAHTLQKSRVPQLQNLIPVRYSVTKVVVGSADSQRVGALDSSSLFGNFSVFKFTDPYAALLLHDKIMTDMILKQFFGRDGQLRTVQHQRKKTRLDQTAVQTFFRPFSHRSIRQRLQRFRRKTGIFNPLYISILFFNRISVFLKLAKEHCISSFHNVVAVNKTTG